MVSLRTAEPQSARERLIAAATRLFAARGFEATPLQDIADEVGLTKPAVLHYFPSKEHLRREVLGAILSHWRDALPRLLLAATASDGRFDAVLGEVYGFFAAQPERARFVTREALDRPAETRELIRGILPVLGAVAGYIRVGQAHGRHYEGVDAEAYVLHILLFVIGAAAVAEATTAALGEGDGARARYDRELARIAKASLFLTAPREGVRERRDREGKPKRRKGPP